MRFFVVPYQIHFDDTMAYGSHHFLTNFRFQCFAREALYFGEGPNGDRLWESDLANLTLLTYEGYSKNLQPVGLGQKVAVFMSMGGETAASLYLFFRVIRFDGVPVCCGFQRAVSVARGTAELAALPDSVAQFVDLIPEQEAAGDFIACAMEVQGRRTLNQLFPAALCEAASRFLKSPEAAGSPYYVRLDADGARYSPTAYAAAHAG
jgi:hypothetical protein